MGTRDAVTNGGNSGYATWVNELQADAELYTYALLAPGLQTAGEQKETAGAAG